MAGILETQNQAWSKNRSNFGFQMLQKMGWSEGAGLGKEGEGAVKPVILRRKLDTNGIGAETRAADAWKAADHMQSSLNSIYASLGAIGEKPKESTKNAGELATAGKAKKASFFSRRAGGKDVKSYSDAHLREILGKSRGSDAQDVQRTGDSDNVQVVPVLDKGSTETQTEKAESEAKKAKSKKAKSGKKSKSKLEKQSSIKKSSGKTKRKTKA